MNLYTHQESVIPEVLRSLRPDNPTLLVSPTGSGKTVMAAGIALHFKRVLFVAHRIEITTQARAELGAHVHVMSIHAALHYGPEAVDLLIIDEAHRATAATYRAIIAKYKGCAVLGLTATPRRTDGQGLIDVFDEIVECSNVKELIESGHLVPYRALEAPDAALKALADMKRKRGDYEQSELSALMTQPRLIGDVVREYLKHGKGRRAVAFAVSVKHSLALCAALLDAGVRAVHLDGNASPKMRAEALQKLSDHQIDVLCNVNLFTEGWDCPAVSCVIMARPTESITLYLQSVGRGMRTCEGKRDLLILDHAGNIARHGYPDDAREWSLESEAQKARREAEVAELERLHALGFDSIEAELEEKARITEVTLSSRECAQVLNRDVLGISGNIASHRKSSNRRGVTFREKDVVRFLTNNGLQAISIRRQEKRFDKKAVQYLVEKFNTSRSISEISKMVGVGRDTVTRLLQDSAVQPIDLIYIEKRYSNSDISTILRDLTFSGLMPPEGCQTIASAQALKVLGLERKSAAWGRVTRKLKRFGRGNACRYALSEVLAISADSLRE